MILWRVTAVNVVGWPVERRNRFTGNYQHFTLDGKWIAGRFPKI